MNDSVRQMWIICGTHVRRVLVDRGTAIWLLALPLALIGVLGMSLQSLMSPDFIPPKPYRGRRGRIGVRRPRGASPTAPSFAPASGSEHGPHARGGAGHGRAAAGGRGRGRDRPRPRDG